jgi:hypothetical protein
MSPSGIMHDGWVGKLVSHAASLKLASTSRQYILNPLAFSTVGQRNQESTRRSKTFSGVPYILPDFRPTCEECRSPEASLRTAR